MPQALHSNWDPYWNRANADVTMLTVTKQDAVELVLASETCRVSRTSTPAGGNVRYHLVIEVEPDVAKAWEDTRR
jgi:hypothetical protein